MYMGYNGIIRIANFMHIIFTAPLMKRHKNNVETNLMIISLKIYDSYLKTISISAVPAPHLNFIKHCQMRKPQNYNI